MDELKNLFDSVNAEYFSKAVVLHYITKFAVGLLAILVGFRVIKIFVRLINRKLSNVVEQSILSFTIPLLRIMLKILLLLVIAGYIGIETTSFVALLAAAGFAVGMALSGVLQDFAGGIFIIVLRPFKVEHLIEVQGHLGIVKEIQLFATKIHTLDNKVIIIPNRSISGSSLTNYSALELRRVDLTFGIGYDDDFKKAVRIIKNIADNHSKVLQDTPPFVRVGELADSSVNITTRLWTKNEDYWDVYFDMIENVKTTFDKENISIPYPQTDVHIKKEN